MNKNSLRMVICGMGLMVLFVVCAGCPSSSNGLSEALHNCRMSAGCRGCQPIQEQPIAAEVFTTRDRMVVAKPPTGSAVSPWSISEYEENGYGNWGYSLQGSSVVKRTDIMRDGYADDSPSVANVARLLNYFAMTDVHITDKESPAQLIYMAMFNSGIGKNAISVYSPAMLFTTHVLDAAMQTVNALHKENPVDFGISLGDVCNSAHFNELRWYIDVLDGKIINPDSGAKDDPVPGPGNDYQDKYKAAGLDRGIPWYQVIGNHDQHWMGSKPKSDYLNETCIGPDIIRLGNVLLPGGMDDRKYYMGTLDGSTVNGDIYGAGPVENFSEEPPRVVADANRRLVSSREWMGEFFKTSSKPVGHGFTQYNLDNDFACYSFEPKSTVPVKVIALDNTTKADTPGIDPLKHVYGFGTLDKKRYDWLVDELEEGQAGNKLMIIAAHVPIGVEPAGSPMGWWPNSHVTEEQLIAKLHEYPNLILWIAGHRHLNTIKPFVSPDAARPELGFWQVETVSLREFPQQIRMFDIVRNSDNTVSILTTNVDPAVAPGSFAEMSRTYAVAAAQTFGFDRVETPQNAELVIQLTPAMQAEIQKYGILISK